MTDVYYSMKWVLSFLDLIQFRRKEPLMTRKKKKKKKKKRKERNKMHWRLRVSVLVPECPSAVVSLYSDVGVRLCLGVPVACPFVSWYLCNFVFWFLFGTSRKLYPPLSTRRHHWYSNIFLTENLYQSSEVVVVTGKEWYIIIWFWFCSLIY